MPESTPKNTNLKIRSLASMVPNIASAGFETVFILMHHWNVCIQRIENSRTFRELLYKKADVRKIKSKESWINAIRTYQNTASSIATELCNAGK